MARHEPIEPSSRRRLAFHLLADALSRGVRSPRHGGLRPPPGGRDRDRDPRAGRQRLRRGDRRRRGGGGAAPDDVRPRRRRVCRRLRRSPARGPRAQRKRRRRIGRDQGALRVRGPPAHAARGRPLGRRPGRRRLLRGDLEALGHPSVGGALGSGDQARAGRRRHHRVGEPVDRRAGRGPPPLPRLGAAVPAGRAAARPGRALGGARSGAKPSRRGHRRRRDLLPGGARRAAPRLPPAGGRALRSGRLRASARRDLRPAGDRHGLPGLPGVRDRSGLPGIPDPLAAEHPGRVRSPRPAAGRHGPHPPLGGGEEARLRGPESPRGRSRVRPAGRSPS